ncbi:hypothetical protein LTR74_009713 [Friedmanniomyces endolithicus]|nr:hypothetical protein LTR74_009713 [Friedmanniomyces endolithicus]
MYRECGTQVTPLQGTWEATEVYQAHKDKEMLRYLVGYPPAQWLMPKEHAQATAGKVLSTFFTRAPSLPAREINSTQSLLRIILSDAYVASDSDLGGSERLALT